jgi:hypothetical protein
MSEGFFSREFRGRREIRDLSGRIPPGQYHERGFPVLSAGPTPHTHSRIGIFPLSVRSINQSAGAGTSFTLSHARRSPQTSTA